MGVGNKASGRKLVCRRSQNDFASDTHDAFSGQPELPLQPSRIKLNDDEKRSIGLRIAKRLERLGEDPWTPNVTTMVDLEVQRGRQFVLSSAQERQLMPATAAERAAEMAISFDLFKQTHDLKNMRHVVLRPVASKVEVHELEARLKLFSDDLSRHIGRLVTDRKVEPILTTIHITFCKTTKKIDLHAHTTWIATDDDHRAARQAIACKFSCFWSEPKEIRNPGAVVNYMATWVVDHREAVEWPDEVLLAVWRLTKARMVRPAGAFAKFRATMKDKRLVRNADGSVSAIDIQKRRLPSSTSVTNADGFRGFARIKLGQISRLCAIFDRKRQPGGQANVPIARVAVIDAARKAKTVRAFKSTAKRGISPHGSCESKLACIPREHYTFEHQWFRRSPGVIRLRPHPFVFARAPPFLFTTA
jgi:hypothetical protein